MLYGFIKLFHLFSNEVQYLIIITNNRKLNDFFLDGLKQIFYFIVFFIRLLVENLVNLLN